MHFFRFGSYFYHYSVTFNVFKVDPFEITKTPKLTKYIYCKLKANKFSFIIYYSRMEIILIHKIHKRRLLKGGRRGLQKILKKETFNSRFQETRGGRGVQKITKKETFTSRFEETREHLICNHFSRNGILLP